MSITLKRKKHLATLCVLLLSFSLGALAMPLACANYCSTQQVSHNQSPHGDACSFPSLSLQGETGLAASILPLLGMIVPPVFFPTRKGALQRPYRPPRHTGFIYHRS